MRFTFYLLIICITPSVGQKKIKTLSITDTITYATVDRVGDLYTMTKSGQIQKFDTHGSLLSVYKKKPAPTLFEARDGARLFAFFRKEGIVEYWSPSFDVTNTFKIDSAFVMDLWLACTSGDHNLWVVEAADNTLKKINPRTSAVEVDVKLPSEISIDLSLISTIREYQGFVFLLDKEKGIHILNGMGKWLKTISGSDISYFNFLGEELYYPAHGKIAYLNLFTGETRETALKIPFTFALLTDERLYSIRDKSIDFFEFKP